MTGRVDGNAYAGITEMKGVGLRIIALCTFAKSGLVLGFGKLQLYMPLQVTFNVVRCYLKKGETAVSPYN
jgi:hypothetical protein